MKAMTLKKKSLTSITVHPRGNQFVRLTNHIYVIVSTDYINLVPVSS